MRIGDKRDLNFAFAFAGHEASLFAGKWGYSTASLIPGQFKEKSNMQKRSLIPMAVFLTCFPFGAQAGQNTGATHDHVSNERKASRKATNIPGNVGSDGKTFTADKDKRIWMVSNPEALSGIDGRHVKVKAQVDTARNEIRILSVTDIAEQRVGIKLDDAAFRR